MTSYASMVGTRSGASMINVGSPTRVTVGSLRGQRRAAEVSLDDALITAATKAEEERGQAAFNEVVDDLNDAERDELRIIMASEKNFVDLLGRKTGGNLPLDDAELARTVFNVAKEYGVLKDVALGAFRHRGRDLGPYWPATID